jgi:hypothetical protein
VASSYDDNAAAVAVATAARRRLLTDAAAAAAVGNTEVAVVSTVIQFARSFVGLKSERLFAH